MVSRFEESTMKLEGTIERLSNFNVSALIAATLVLIV